VQEKSGGRWILEIDASFAFFYKKKEIMYRLMAMK
jgi:hypothetical protein